MAIIALKAWYLEKYEPIREVVKRPHDLRLSRNSLLKTGLRADLLDDSLEIQKSTWFQRYLEGETIEFYIEGSGGYAISNIDLISQEIYFTKQEITATLEPIIYFSPQRQYPQSTEALRTVLEETLETLNKRSRLPLNLVETPHPTDTPVRLSDSQLRIVRKCLLFIVDATPITQVGSDSILSPNSCVELGYAIHSKRSGQILLAYQQRSDLSGKIPFDLPQHQQLGFSSVTELRRTLPSVIETLLQKFNLTV